MKIEVINEKRLNHIHYCRVHKENQQLSGSFWVPSKSKSKNKKMFSFEDVHFETLEKRLMRLSNVTDRLAEYSMQLREMHQTQVEMRQNQIMQFLTIVTTIFMPLTLITGWYGMNFKAMPELDTSYGYFIVIGVCILIIILEVIYFKKKKWF